MSFYLDVPMEPSINRAANESRRGHTRAKVEIVRASGRDSRVAGRRAAAAHRELLIVPRRRGKREVRGARVALLECRAELQGRGGGAAAELRKLTRSADRFCDHLRVSP